MAQFKQIVDVWYPIVQAPMVGVSTPALAAAVSNAGALGSIGVGSSTAEQARSLIRQTRELTDRPFNVNLFCHQPALADSDRELRWLDYLGPYFSELGVLAPQRLELPYTSFCEQPETLAMLLEEKPAVVSLHFGLPPAEWIEQLKQAGIRLIATATNIDEAVTIEKAGLHGIVAQGREAGGHSGVFDPSAGDPELGTLPLVQLILDRCKLPVIAAGGIMDGRGIRAVQDLGACGVQMGTAFILCPESAADDRYRRILIRGEGLDTRITSVISGRPARGIVDRWWREVDSGDHPPCPDYPIAYSAGKALKRAGGDSGQFGFDAYWAGQGVSLARQMPAGELVQQLVEEMYSPD